MKDFNMRAAKALISFAVTAKLICALFSPKHFVGFLMQWLIFFQNGSNMEPQLPG